MQKGDSINQFKTIDHFYKTATELGSMNLNLIDQPKFSVDSVSKQSHRGSKVPPLSLKSDKKTTPKRKLRSSSRRGSNSNYNTYVT